MPAIALCAALTIACGDGSSTDDPTPTPTATATSTPRPDPTLPPPADRSDDAVAVVVVAGDRNYQPTVAEFRALPTAESGGIRGVTLAELAARLGLEGDPVVTVEGRSADLSQIRYWRGRLTEAEGGLVLEIDDAGLLRLGGSLIPEAGWLSAVETIAFE